MKNKIILCYPEKRVRDKVLSIAYGILPVAGALMDSGFKVQVLDTRVQDYENIKLDDVLFVGISAMTGQQIKHGLKVSEWVKKKNKNIPVVWGGIHPTLLPEETVKNKNVDIVVMGEGEDVIVELAKRLKENEPYDDLKGIAFKKGKKIIKNERAEFTDLNRQKIPPYQVLEKSKYDFNEFVSYCSSRGCPHRCKFCFNQAFYNRKYHARDIDKVMEDLKWIKKNLKPKRMGFVDDNFFVNKNRVEELCKRMIKEKLSLKWTAMCRLDYLQRFDEDFLKLVKKSGCYELGLGAESGSQKTLNLMKKDLAPEQIIEGTKKCVTAGIHPVISFIGGYPGETKKDLFETIDMIKKLRKIDPSIEINGLFIFTPYPGSPIYEELKKKYNIKFPKNLEEWGDWDFSDKNILKWMDKKHLSLVSTVSTIVRYQFLKKNMKKYAKKYWKEPRSIAFLAINPLFELSSGLRWKLKFFKFPLEWKAWAYMNKKIRGEH